MDTQEFLVLTGSVGAVAFVLWYFFGARPQAAARASAAGVQEVTITVRGGHDPPVVVVQKGRPVRLNFHREETSSCSEQVVLSDFGLVKDLPPHATTPVEFTPDRAGEFTFTCGMGMLRGKVVVQAT